jgi:hypothetical protein
MEKSSTITITQLQTDFPDNNEDDSQNSKPPIILCEVCSQNQFKYKCPRCLIKTCCLYCVKKHKKEKNCSGKRDKFKSKTLNEITLNDIRTDMTFMNETINETNKASKKLYEKTSEFLDQKEKEKLRKNMKKFAKKFRNINLITCPSGIKKFLENKSYIDTKEKKFYWTVKFIFWDRSKTAGESNQSEKLEFIFPQPFDDSDFTLEKLLKWARENKNEMSLELLMYLNNLDLDHDLDFMYRINIKELDKNLIKGRLIKIDKFYYEILDRYEMLKDVLNGKDVYEFPEIYVVKKNFT